MPNQPPPDPPGHDPLNGRAWYESSHATEHLTSGASPEEFRRDKPQGERHRARVSSDPVDDRQLDKRQLDERPMEESNQGLTPPVSLQDGVPGEHIDAAAEDERASAKEASPVFGPYVTICAVSLELALLVVALVGSRIPGLHPILTSDASMSWGKSLVLGVLAVAPLLMFGIGAEFLRSWPFGDLRQTADQLLTPMFRNLPVWKMAMIALAAGCCEEIFFRWWLQGLIAAWISDPNTTLIVSVFGAAAVFGVCHWLSPAYGLMAFAAGVFLGLLYVRCGNIVAPIVCHALYDFLAIFYVARIRRIFRPELFLAAE